MGIAQAEHEESAPDAPTLIVSRLACSLVESSQMITLLPGTLVHQLYGQTAVTEQFSCNFGLNPCYQDQLAAHGLRMAGADADGEIRVVELSTHPFFVATLFLPQARSSAACPHPLIIAYLKAAYDQRH